MKLQITVRHKNVGSEWVEDYNRPEIRNLNQAVEWGNKLIDNFNDSLRPGEKPREFVDVVEAPDSDTVAQHEWHKTNLITIVTRGTNYDKMLCLRCGITGKRHGIGQSGVQRDPKFKAKKYETCTEQK